MAPETFGRQGVYASVVEQPQTQRAKQAALAAQLSCPCDAIHSDATDSDIELVKKTYFPHRIVEQVR
eukprot:2860860-Prorocentrum_lima.AAC.1